MPQTIISMDSQILNGIQACARKTQYSFVEHLSLPGKAGALERGSLLHTCLEVYDGLFLDDGPNLESQTWKELKESGIIPSWSEVYTNPYQKSHPQEARAFAIEAGRFYAAKMDLAGEDIDATIYQFSEYTKHFENDGWHVLAVEEVGSKVLYESEHFKVIYNFKIDKVAEKGNLIMPWDYKSSSRRQEISSLSNQFIGYCWGLNLKQMMVVKIGFQKTLKPSERFERQILQYSTARIAEWVQNAVDSAQILANAISDNYFPMNLTSCDKYSGCIYRTICEKDPSSREWEIDKHYVKGEPWDVSGALIQIEKD